MRRGEASPSAALRSHLPLRTGPQTPARNAPAFKAFLQHQNYNNYYKRRNSSRQLERVVFQLRCSISNSKTKGLDFSLPL